MHRLAFASLPLLVLAACETAGDRSGTGQCPTGEVCESDGFCHYPCTSLNQCKLIDNRFVACDGVCKTDQEVNPQCTLTMPCPTGKTCISNTCL